MMVLLYCLCILSVIATTYEQLSKSGAACPKYPKGTCTYEAECPDYSRHGICGSDENHIALVCCTSSGTTKVLKYWNIRTLPDRTQCGRSDVLNQVYGGDRTEIREYPWMVALLYVVTNNTTLYGVQCGGTLINEKFVLTAAHCLNDQTAESIRVQLGDWNIASDPDRFPGTGEIKYAPKVINATIDKIISHEYYSSATKRNDIALLRLKTPVHFTDYVRPICLPSRDFPALTSEVDVVVAGWGITDTLSRSDILLKATLHVLTNNQCLEKIQRTGRIHETEFCAANGDSDACKGDSGGPLMSSYKDYSFNWFQLGIVGSGPDCSKLGPTATIYTRVSSFVGWIFDQITPQSEIDSPCITPDNRNGSCVPVDQCPVVEQQYLQPGSSSEVEFIRRSLCGVHVADRSDMVCCRLSQIKRENTMEGSLCKTPEPELKDGRCVRITNCPALKDASKAAREHIEKYQCGFDDELLVCCKTQDIVVASEPKYLEEFSSANIPNRTVCGRIRSYNTKSEYPWLAALMAVDSTEPNAGYDVLCAGSLINKRFVLTAASFFDDERILNYRVLLGTVNSACHKTSDCPSSMQNLTVEQVIQHPFYHILYSLNDIALVRLGSDVVFNDYVSPICLPPPNLQPLGRGSEVIMATWEYYWNRNPHDNGKGILLNAQSCKEKPESITIHKHELCIPTIIYTEGPCGNVRGGSITRAHKDQLGQNLFLEGMDSHTRDCISIQHLQYTMIVRISAYTSWILRTITETT